MTCQCPTSPIVRHHKPSIWPRDALESEFDSSVEMNNDVIRRLGQTWQPLFLVWDKHGSHSFCFTPISTGDVLFWRLKVVRWLSVWSHPSSACLDNRACHLHPQLLKARVWQAIVWLRHQFNAAISLKALCVPLVNQVDFFLCYSPLFFGGAPPFPVDAYSVPHISQACEERGLSSVRCLYCFSPESTVCSKVRSNPPFPIFLCLQQPVPVTSVWRKSASSSASTSTTSTSVTCPTRTCASRSRPRYLGWRSPVKSWDVSRACHTVRNGTTNSVNQSVVAMC